MPYFHRFAWFRFIFLQKKCVGMLFSWVFGTLSSVARFQPLKTLFYKRLEGFGSPVWVGIQLISIVLLDFASFSCKNNVSEWDFRGFRGSYRVLLDPNLPKSLFYKRLGMVFASICLILLHFLAKKCVQMAFPRLSGILSSAARFEPLKTLFYKRLLMFLAPETYVLACLPF